MALVYDRKKEFPIDPRLNQWEGQRSLVLLLQGSSHLCQAAWRCPEDPRGELPRWLERGVGMLTLEVPRGREGLCGHHGGIAGDIGNLQGVGEDRN